MNTPDIVIDKSYLHGGPKEELAQIFQDHRILMSEALFFELMTTTPRKRAQCFKRIPSVPNPVLLLPNVVPLLKWEQEHREPITDFDTVSINVRFKFHGLLTDDAFELGETELEHLTNWKKQVKIDVDNFRDFSAGVFEVFTGMENFRPGGDASLIDTARKLVCEDLDITKYIYECGEYEGWPPSRDINEDWAIFRWWQIRILASLDLYKKHGRNIKQLSFKTLENEFHDLEYCFYASLCGRFATKDNGLADKFKSVCSKGILI